MTNFGSHTERFARETGSLIVSALEADPGPKDLIAQIEASSIPAATKKTTIAAIRASENDRRLVQLRAFGDALAASLRGIGLHVECRPLRRKPRKHRKPTAGGPLAPAGEASTELGGGGGEDSDAR